MTWSVVRQSFPAWTAQFEGRIPWMYLDAKGKVTAGVGYLIDSIDDAIQLPWLHPDGSRASAADIADAWRRVHDAQHLAGIGGGKPAFRDLTSLRLSPDVFDRLTLAKFDANDHALLRFFPRFGEFPADAQQGIHSMAYAMGTDRFARFPLFVAAANALDFATAADESHMSEVDNEPLHDRNVADRELFLRAKHVVAEGLPRDAFYTGPVAPTPPRIGRGPAIVALLALVGGAAWFATRHL